MNVPSSPDHELEQRLSARLLDVFIRAGLVLAMTMLCYKIFSPFLELMMWALILAVTMYPVHRRLSKMLGGKQGLAATLLVLIFLVLIVVPTALLIDSSSDSIHKLINNVNNNTLQIPAPSPNVADWPIVGKKIHAFWSLAYSDLPAVLQSMQPKIGDLAKHALVIVAGTGGNIMKFIFSFIIAGVIMAFGESGTRAALSIFERIVGIKRGKGFTDLSTATIRTVAAGVIGIACIQALLIGVGLIYCWHSLARGIVAGRSGAGYRPDSGAPSHPACDYLHLVQWGLQHHRRDSYTVLLLVSGTADNVLKPLMLGRGVDAPMPVILLGALGGMPDAGRGGHQFYGQGTEG